MSAYIKRIEISKINDLMLCFKLLEKQEQANPKTSSKYSVKRAMLEVSQYPTSNYITKQ
jgi:hypothetical protein